jgi:hypothetical protein
MADEGSSFPDVDGISQNVIPNDDVVRLWARFRAGDVVPCPRDEASFALAVDGAAKSYRLICTKCGLASPWFGTTPTGLVLRGHTSTLVPEDSHDE